MRVDGVGFDISWMGFKVVSIMGGGYSIAMMTG
jgi:hypothetical protein